MDFLPKNKLKYTTSQDQFGNNKETQMLTGLLTLNVSLRVYVYVNN